MRFDKTAANLEALKAKKDVSLSEAISFIYNFAEDIEENSGAELCDQEVGDVTMLGKRLPWMSLLVSDIFDKIRSDLKPGKGKDKLEQMQEKLSEIEGSLSENAREMDEMGSILSELKSREEQLLKSKEELEKQKAESRMLHGGIEALEMQTKQLRQQIQNAEQSSELLESQNYLLKREFEEKNDRAIKAKETKLSLEMQMHSAEDEIRELDEKISSVNIEIMHCKENLSMKKELLVNKQKEWQGLNNDVQSLNNDIQNQNEECQKLIHDINLLNQELQLKDNQNLKDKLLKQKTELEMTKIQLGNVEEEIRKLSGEKESYENNYRNVLKQREQLALEIKELSECGDIEQTRNRELTTQRDSLKERLGSFHAGEYTSQIKDMSEQIERMETTLQELSRDRKALEELYSESGLFIKEENMLSDELAEVKKHFRNLKRDYSKVISIVE